MAEGTIAAEPRHRPLPLSERLAQAIVLSSEPLGAVRVTIDEELGREAVRALELGSAAYSACMSAWAAGEPPHRVEAMIAAVEALGTALGEPGAPKDKEKGCGPSPAAPPHSDAPGPETRGGAKPAADRKRARGAPQQPQPGA